MAGFHHDPAWYVDAGGNLEAAKLLAAFQDFFRMHSERWIERFQYKEAGPQLLLQAFLQRIVHNGGRIEREYGLGRMRTDLLIVWPAKSGGGRPRNIVIECKLLHRSLEQSVAQGLEQTQAYMDRCAATEGHLVVFDRSEGKSWDEKVFRREETAGDTRITRTISCSGSGCTSTNRGLGLDEMGPLRNTKREYLKRHWRR